MNITYRNTEPSDALNDAIEARLEKLRNHHQRIDRCDVVITAPSEGQTGPGLFECHLEIHVPGHSVTVTRHPNVDTHKDPYKTVHDAFDAAERQLEVRSHRGGRAGQEGGRDSGGRARDPQRRPVGTRSVQGAQHSRAPAPSFCRCGRL